MLTEQVLIKTNYDNREAFLFVLLLGKKRASDYVNSDSFLKSNLNRIRRKFKATSKKIPLTTISGISLFKHANEEDNVLFSVLQNSVCLDRNSNFFKGGTLIKELISCINRAKCCYYFFDG